MFIQYITLKLGLQIGEHMKFMSLMLRFHTLSICGCAFGSLQTCRFKMVFLFMASFCDRDVAFNFMWVLYATIIFILLCDKRTRSEKFLMQFCNFARPSEILRLNFPWSTWLASVLLIFVRVHMDVEFCFVRSNY